MMTIKNQSGPKIKEFNITPIAVVDPPLLNAAGLHAPYALRTIVDKVNSQTDDARCTVISRKVNQNECILVSTT